MLSPISVRCRGRILYSEHVLLHHFFAEGKLRLLLAGLSSIK